MIVNESVARKNIDTMADKAAKNKVLFRPHFKTHQSKDVALWFREKNIHTCTVSSVDMAIYFANHGWKDITISSVVNLLQLDKINELAASVSLNLVVDNLFSAAEVAERMKFNTGVFVKIDTGAGRCGLLPTMSEEIISICSLFKQSKNADFKGLLIHSGHTYGASSRQEIEKIYERDKRILTELKSHLQSYCDSEMIISIGDTPGCCSVDDFSWADEIRPGNFVYFDLFQWQKQICNEQQIACMLACPVMGIYPEKNQLIIYGGAVHFSKDFLLYNNQPIYGMLAEISRNNQLIPDENILLTNLWQEHGLVSLPQHSINKYSIGDILTFIPVHSCLTVSAIQNCRTTEGNMLGMFQ